MLESWRQLTDFWFLHAYVFMMMLTPIVDSALETKHNVRTWFVPLALLCFGWSFANAVLNSHPSIKWIVPATPGLGAFTGLTLIGVYAIGRVFRFKRDEVKLPRLVWISAALVSVLGCIFEFNQYNSPCSVVLAIIGFVACEKVIMPNWLARSILFVSPSMFSVYLLQTNRFFIPKFAVLARAVHMESALIKYLIVALFVFAFCTLIDMARRMVVGAVRRIL